MADIGDEFAARVLELLEAREIVKDQNGSVSLALFIEQRGGVHLQPAIFEQRQFQFATEDRRLLLKTFHDVGESLEAECFQNSLASDFSAHRKEPAKRI